MPTKTTKKTSAKRPAKKVAKPATMPIVKPVFTDIPEPERYCHCTKRKRNTILTCVSTIFFLIGFIVSHFFFCDCHHRPMPRLSFVNGCVDVASIKCPKLLEQLPMIDSNNDGCITRTEMRAAKRAMRHHDKPAEEPVVNAEDAIAPVLE